MATCGPLIASIEIRGLAADDHSSTLCPMTLHDPNHSAALVMAGIPAINKTLYRAIRFNVGDPAVLIRLPASDGRRASILIVRDIEIGRAKLHACADRVHCPRDFTPAAGLSGDRETSTAQAAAECLARHGVNRVVADRSLPLIYAKCIGDVGISVTCDTELGVTDRRRKDEREIEFLREAQAATESAVRLACETIAKAGAGACGVLVHENNPLTSERLRTIVDVWLMRQGYDNPVSIIAGGPIGADCHHHGAGVLRTGEPIIVDIFPANRSTRYNGDCTRTVVHGEVPEVVKRMHAAVVEAKAAAIAATRAGVTGERVHDATKRVLESQGYLMGFPHADAGPGTVHMPHGTGHGVGLDVHEPPLLDTGGPELLAGDVLTIEPALYANAVGGVRVEDMVVVTASGAINLNHLPEGLVWK